MPAGWLRGTPYLRYPSTRADEERVILFPEKVCKKPATRRSGKIPRLPGLGTAGAKGNLGSGGGSRMIGLSGAQLTAPFIRSQTGRGISLRS